MDKKFLKLHKEKIGYMACVALLALLPFLCAWVRCLIDERSLAEVYLPVSPWNDELFYYKLTENVVDFGYPQGYFGFNESHGQYLSFAAWSPVLLIFWVIWGLVFGWNLLSPILCNIALLSLSMLLFGILVKPDKQQTFMIGLSYAAFMPVTRFALSCIPEAELFALFILFLGVTISCERNSSGWKIGSLFALAMLMAWMRPYLILLFLTPAVLLLRRKGKKTLLLSGSLALVTAAVYAAVNHFFSAPYLTDLFYTEWVTVYFKEGLFRGLYYTAWKLYDSFRTVIDLIVANITVGSGLVSAAGLYYFIFLLLTAILLVKLFFRFRRRDWQGFLLEGQLLLCMAGFFAADLLMYRIQEGGRHTLVYIVGCLFAMPVLPPTENSSAKRRGLQEIGLAAVFILLFTMRGNIPYEFSIPYSNGEYAAELDKLSSELSENMQLSGTAPNYDNTVIWTFADTVDGEVENVDFGSYYAVPTGFGINLCDMGYMEVNLEKLQSRYIGVAAGGGFEERCLASGGTLVGKNKYLAVYRAR